MLFSSSDETAVENWTSEHYDLNNDPYISEAANQELFQGVWRLGVVSSSNLDQGRHACF